MPEPDPPDVATNRAFFQCFARGGARFSRLEGVWYGNQRVCVVSTSGGNAGQGQVWEYDPAAETLRLLFESPHVDVLNRPDNVCVSPRGGLVLCEDGSGTEYLHGLTTELRSSFPLDRRSQIPVVRRLVTHGGSHPRGRPGGSE